MKSDVTQASFLNSGLEVVVNEVSTVENSARFGREHEIIRDARLAPQERLKKPLIPQFGQHPAQLP
jgi:hypothetical protein